MVEVAVSVVELSNAILRFSIVSGRKRGPRYGHALA